MMSPGSCAKIFWASFAREIRFMLLRLFRNSSIVPIRTIVSVEGSIRYTGKPRISCRKSMQFPGLFGQHKIHIVLREVILSLSLAIFGVWESVFPMWGMSSPSLLIREKVFSVSPAKDRGFVAQLFPVIPLLFPVPDRVENGHDHGQHHQKSDAEERPEQDIHHGNPPSPLGAMNVRPRVSLTTHKGAGFSIPYSPGNR